MTIETFLNKLQKVKRLKNGEWVACCPVHDDKSPSLSITDDNGKVLIYCFGCGAKAPEIAGALGVDISELFPPKENYDPNIKQTRKYFPANQIYESLTDETMVILIIANDMLKNGIQKETYDRLSLAIKRIQHSKEYYAKNR